MQQREKAKGVDQSVVYVQYRGLEQYTVYNCKYEFRGYFFNLKVTRQLSFKIIFAGHADINDDDFLIRDERLRLKAELQALEKTKKKMQLQWDRQQRAFEII